MSTFILAGASNTGKSSLFAGLRDISTTPPYSFSRDNLITSTDPDFKFVSGRSDDLEFVDTPCDVFQMMAITKLIEKNQSPTFLITYNVTDTDTLSARKLISEIQGKAPHSKFILVGTHKDAISAETPRLGQAEINKLKNAVISTDPDSVVTVEIDARKKHDFAFLKMVCAQMAAPTDRTRAERLLEKLHPRLDDKEIINDGQRLYNLIQAMGELEKKIKKFKRESDDNSPESEKLKILKPFLDKLFQAVDSHINAPNKALLEDTLPKAFQELNNSDVKSVLSQRRHITKAVANVALCVSAILLLPVGLLAAIAGISYKATTGKSPLSFFKNTDSENKIEAIKDAVDALIPPSIKPK